MATAGGAFLGVAWLPTVITIGVFILVVLVTRIASVASLLAALTFPVAVLFWVGPRAPLFVVACAMTLFVIWTHRANIGRIRRGEEPRIGTKAQVPAR